MEEEEEAREECRTRLSKVLCGTQGFHAGRERVTREGESEIAAAGGSREGGEREREGRGICITIYTLYMYKHHTKCAETGLITNQGISPLVLFVCT